MLPIAAGNSFNFGRVAFPRKSRSSPEKRASKSTIAFWQETKLGSRQSMIELVSKAGSISKKAIHSLDN